MKKLLLVLVLLGTTTIFAQSYNQGFKDGWKNAYKIGSISTPIAPIAPIPPIPGIGRSTYQDGFADGAAAAYGKLNSNPQSTSRKSYNNITANEWEKVYNSGSYADESKRIGNSVDNAINENRQRRQYSNSSSNSGIDYTYWNSAIKKADSENWEGAIRDMSTFIGQYPNSKEAWGNRGQFKTNLGNWNGACYDWKRAAELGSEMAQGFMLDYCNSDGSVKEIAKKSDSNRELALEYFNSGIAKAQADDYSEAIGDFTKAIELEPRYGNAYFFRARSKQYINDYQGAKEDMDKFIEIVPSDGDSYYYRGWYKLNLNDNYGAIADFSKSIQLENKFKDTYSYRGKAKSNTKDFKGAIADFTKAIELDPESAIAFYNRGLAKSNTKDFKGAIADYTKAIELQPDLDLKDNSSEYAFYYRGKAKNNLKDYKGAIADFTKAIELYPGWAMAYYERGIAKRILKDHKGAILDFTKAIELKPNEAVIFVNRAVSKRESGDPKGAIEDYNKGIAIDPNMTTLWGGRGTAKSYLKDMDGACADWNKAVVTGDNIDSQKFYQEKIDENCLGMTKEKAIAKLKELKELLDLEVITQKDYDKEKAILSPIILGKN